MHVARKKRRFDWPQNDDVRTVRLFQALRVRWRSPTRPRTRSCSCCSMWSGHSVGPAPASVCWSTRQLPLAQRVPPTPKRSRPTADQGTWRCCDLWYSLRTRQHRGNQSVPRIIIHNTINLFFKTAISSLVISNHNSFRVLFDEIASVFFYFISKNTYILVLKMASPGNQLCQLYRHTFVPCMQPRWHQIS